MMGVSLDLRISRQMACPLTLPSSLGRFKSSKMQSGCAARASEAACSKSVHTRVSYPSSMSSFASSLRIALSSSTM